MAGKFCLMPEAKQKFTRALKDGTLHPDKLANMTSAERHDLFGKFVGPLHAEAVNAEFESKLLLKNQQQGFLNWAKNVSGIKPEVRRDMIAKIERMQNVLDPAEKKQFMHDLTARRLGIDVTEEEAKNIANLSKRVTELESLRQADKTFPSEVDRMKYGYAVEDMTDYIAKLKQDASRVSLMHAREVVSNRGIAGGVGLMGKFAGKVAGNMKSMQAAYDDSALFHQGWKPMLTNPIIWSRNATDTFRTIAREIGGKNVLREVNADIISRPNYDRFVKGNLAVKNPEEAFPESFASKVPGLRRLYNASEAAFTAFQYKMRADIADKAIALAEKQGKDINDPEELKAMMSVINSITGRANMGKAERVASAVNNAFFSPRYLKSQLDLLTQPLGGGGAKTTFARNMARKNLVLVVGGTLGILFAADKAIPGSVEWDPRSSDFGRVKIGNTRFDVTGGLAPLIVLISQEISGKSKNSTTGITADLRHPKFSQQNSVDKFTNFFMNRLSPAPGIARDIGKGKTPSGSKTSIKQELISSLTPFGKQTYDSLKQDPGAANAFWGTVMDGLGLSATDYAPAGSNGQSTWSQSTSKKVNQFQQKIGTKNFNTAATKFDNTYNNWISSIKNDPRYKAMSNSEKQKQITMEKKKIESDIFKAYGFKYHQQKSKTKLIP